MDQKIDRYGQISDPVMPTDIDQYADEHHY